MMCRNHPSRAQALIIGAGVSGLTTAIALQKRGIHAIIIADKFQFETTSVIAGALWEWPPAVCGFHQNPISLSRSKPWARRSYEVFETLAQDPGTGVKMLTSVFFFRQPVAGSAAAVAKMEEIRENLRNFVHDPSLIAQNGVNPGFGLQDAYAHLV